MQRSVEPGSGSLANDLTPPFGTIVDDGVNVREGQVARGPFWAELEARVERAAEEELARAGHSSADCPYLRHWLDHYRRQPAARLERAIQRYARPRETDAESLVEAVLERVRAAIRIWATSRAFPSLPPEVTAAMPASLPLPESTAVQAPQAKADTAGAVAIPPTTDPAAVRARLSHGRPLGGAVRSRMERGFGRSFADVRVHTDANATRMATAYSARAFAVGSDIAFNAGRYRPGSIEGDLLLAHELAHVLQQRGDPVGAPASARAAAAGLERDADFAAARAVARSSPRSEVEAAARHAFGRDHDRARRLLDEEEAPGALSPLRLQRCDFFNPEPPQLQTEWDEEEVAPDTPEPPQPIAPVVPERTPEEEGQARAAESTFAIGQIWGVLSGIDTVGAGVEIFVFTSNGAVTMVSWRRSADGTGRRGSEVSGDAFRARLERILPTFVGTTTRYVKVSFRRESSRWQLDGWTTEAPAGAPAAPPEGRTIPANVSGYTPETYGRLVEIAGEMHPLLETPRSGSAEFVATLELEDDRIPRWSPASWHRLSGTARGTVRPPEHFRSDIVNALLPFTTGVGSRTVRITLRGSHASGEPSASWSVREVGIDRPAVPVTDEAAEIVADYRRRHQEIMRRWREGVRDVAVYAGMIGVRELAFWVIGGVIFRVAGLGLRAVAPRIAQMFSRGASAATAGWLETLITRLAPAERASLTRLMTKVETEGAAALTAAERAELQRIFGLLDNLITTPLTHAEKGYLRTAMHGRYGAAQPAAVAAFRAAGRAYQIHHRVPLEYAHMFPRIDINAGANLIALETTVHRGVNAVWTRFRTAPTSRITPAHVDQVAAIVDRHFGHWYHQVPPTAGLGATVEAAKNAARAEVDLLLAAL